MDGQFNAIDYAQQLEAAGVPQAQAEVHAKMLALALVSCSASKADLAALGDRLDGRIDRVRQELLDRFNFVRQELFDRIEAVRLELSGRIDLLEQEIKSLRRQFYWMFGIHSTLLIAILIKLYFP